MSTIVLPKFESGMKTDKFLKSVVRSLKPGGHSRVGFAIGNVGDGHSLNGMCRKFEALESFTKTASGWVDFPVFSMTSIFEPSTFYGACRTLEGQIELGLVVERLLREAKVTDAFLMPGWHGSHAATLQRMVATSLMVYFHTGKPESVIVAPSPAIVGRVSKGLAPHLRQAA